MKRLLVCGMLLAALNLSGGCSDNSEVFYSISYPIVRLEADVTLPTPEPEEPSTGDGSESGGTQEGDTQTGEGSNESGTSSAPANTSSRSEEDSSEPVDPLVAQIQAEVIAEAPVQAGGGYVLDFTRYNRGPLTVDTASEAGVVQGAFFKEPGATQINLFFLGETYACTLSSYTDSDGIRKVLLTVDLTDLYQQRYPSAGLTKVIRREYTSTRTN